MANDDKEHTGYVDKVREENQSYVRGLLNDIETLRMCVANLENDNARLQQDVRALRAEMAFRDTQETQLQEKLSEIRAESERRLAEYAQLEQHNANLANLYVASYQLHGTLRRDAVLSAIQEIVINLVGSEEFAVFSTDEDGELRLIAAVGLSDASQIHRRDPHVAAAVASGETWVRGDGDDTSLTACIPLKIDGRVTGFVAIYRLLPQKNGVQPLDHELFDLLATHAGTALYCTALESVLV